MNLRGSSVTLLFKEWLGLYFVTLTKELSCHVYYVVILQQYNMLFLVHVKKPTKYTNIQFQKCSILENSQGLMISFGSPTPELKSNCAWGYRNTSTSFLSPAYRLSASVQHLLFSWVISSNAAPRLPAATPQMKEQLHFFNMQTEMWVFIHLCFTLQPRLEGCFYFCWCLLPFLNQIVHSDNLHQK